MLPGSRVDAEDGRVVRCSDGIMKVEEEDYGVYKGVLQYEYES